jgi:hypothetical protein
MYNICIIYEYTSINFILDTSQHDSLWISLDVCMVITTREHCFLWDPCLEVTSTTLPDFLLSLWAGPLCSWGIWVRAPYMKKKESNCQQEMIPTPRWTGRLTVGRNTTWNWTWICVIALLITERSSRQRGSSTTRKMKVIVTQRNVKCDNLQ